jgi:N-acetylmuramoyl-L-alanine amidase
LNIMDGKNRKFLYRALVFVLLAPTACGVYAAGSPQEPQSPDYVPFDVIVETFELDFSFDAATGMLTLGKEGKQARLVPGSTELFVQKDILHLPLPVRMDEGMVLIPAQGVDVILRRILGRAVRWSYVDGRLATGSDAVVSQSVSRDTQQKRRTPKTSSAFDIQTIIIDPGHGGKDPGGVGHRGIKEKDIVLDVSLALYDELRKKFRDKKILITRETDIFLSLEERGRFANTIDPDENALFISIHANASFDVDSRGFETYFLSLSPVDEEARSVASMENSVLTFEYENYDDYLVEIINRIVDVEYRRESMRLASYIQKQLKTVIGKESVDRGVKNAFFYVLKSSKMPGALVEIGFVTNKEESQKMLKGEYQEKIARGITDGISDFISEFRRTEGFTKSLF